MSEAKTLEFYEKYPLADQFWYKGFLRSGTEESKEVLEALPDAEIRDSDVVIATYPKCGTTWVAEIASLLLSDGDFDMVSNTLLRHRAPYFDFLESIEELDNMPRDKPRLIRTHLIPELLPLQLKSKGKVILVFRNPKDVAVSYLSFYRLHKIYDWYEGTWDEFLQAYMKGHVHSGSIFEYSALWQQESKNYHPLILTYEGLQRDPHANVRKIAEFIGKNVDEDTVNKIVEHTSFSKMQSNPMANWSESVENGKMKPDKAGCGFFRKGVVGDWKNHFTVAQNEVFDKLLQKYSDAFPQECFDI